LRLGEIELSIVALHTSSPVDFPQIAGWRLDRGLNNYKLLREHFSMTFHTVSSLRRVFWCVRLTHPRGFRSRRYGSSGNAAALSIYGDVF
jgi:hypothetical protein